VGVAVGVGVGLGVFVGEAVGEGVFVGDGVGEGVFVGDAVGGVVGAGVGLAVGAGEGVGVAVPGQFVFTATCAPAVESTGIAVPASSVIVRFCRVRAYTPEPDWPVSVILARIPGPISEAPEGSMPSPKSTAAARKLPSVEVESPKELSWLAAAWARSRLRLIAVTCTRLELNTRSNSYPEAPRLPGTESAKTSILRVAP
jgi:hypothetical protein